MAPSRLHGVPRRPGRRAGLLWPLVCLVAWLDWAALAPPVRAQGTPPVPPPTPAPTALAPTPIPVPEIASYSEDVAALVRRIDRALEPTAGLEAIAAQLPDLSARIAIREADTERMIAEGAQLRALEHMAGSWQTLRAQLLAWNQSVTGFATGLEQDGQDLARRLATWQLSREEARRSKAPAEVLERIDATLGSIASAQQRVARRRSAVLVLQARVADDLATAEHALAIISEARIDRVGHLYVRDTRPVWQADLSAGARTEMASRIGDVLAFDLGELRDFLAADAARLTAQIAGILFVAALFRHARQLARPLIEQAPELERTLRILLRPYSSALVLSVLATRLFHPEAPQLVARWAAILALVPTLRLLRLVLPPTLLPTATVVLTFFVLDQVRDIASAAPQLEQLLLLVELLLGMGLAAWLLAGRPPLAVRLFEASRLPRPAALLRLVLAMVVVALVAGAFGYMQLARLLGGSVLASSYLGAVLYVALSVVQGLLAVALRTPPLRDLRVVARHLELLEHRTRRALAWLAGGIWLLALLRNLGLDDLLTQVVRDTLAADLAPSQASVALGDLAVFGLTLWVAFLASRFVRFVLDEEVYPRVDLPRGIPYAISTVLHYSLVAGGFVLALAGVGLDLNRATILAGAFGVGIGFGLQNVVNNFVSGLILLFERPIQVGDAIQVGDVLGEVKRIGIRSSTVRTQQGAEVIVPNGNLVADRVTNWTLSDRMRRVDLAVGVAYGTDPERVLGLLRDVARTQPGVIADPPTQALFVGFGASSLDFELRFWTSRFDQWVVVRSDVAVAVCKALETAGIEVPFPQREVRLRGLPPTTDAPPPPGKA